MSYNEPTQQTFIQAESALSDILQNKFNELASGYGSTIRELIIRPCAYLYAWCEDAINALWSRFSLSSMQQSMLTNNEYADIVASNFFVSRRSGVPSKGLLLLELATNRLTIGEGTTFSVEDVTLVTKKTYVITDTDGLIEDSDAFDYLRAIKSGESGIYLVALPVECSEPGPVEIPAGAVAVAQSYTGSIIRCEVCSPITGGIDTETDSSMAKRIASITADAGVGTLYGVQKRLDKAPVSVLSFAPIVGESSGAFRARSNSTSINPGGYVDLYIKTQQQEAVKEVRVRQTNDDDSPIKFYDNQIRVRITAAQASGCYTVSRVMLNGISITDFDIYFGSDTPGESSSAARLSLSQWVDIDFKIPVDFFGKLPDTENEVVCFISYMPGMRELQQYLDMDENTFIGQNIDVRAAVPVYVGLTCNLTSDHAISDDDVTSLKGAVMSYINSIPVGSKYINFSEIRKMCDGVVPGCELCLPCIFTAKQLMKDGTQQTFHSNTGILDLDNVFINSWAHDVSFFSTSPSNINLVTV